MQLKPGSDPVPDDLGIRPRGRRRRRSRLGPGHIFRATEGVFYAVALSLVLPLATASLSPFPRALAGGPWNAMASQPLTQAAGAAVTGRDGKIYVFGGVTGPSKFTAQVEAYNPKTNAWTSRAPMPKARWALAAALGTAGRIYTFGGLALFKGTTVNRVWALRKTEIYDPATNRWSQGAQMPIGGRSLAAATGPDGNIYVFGGFRQNYGKGGVLNTVQIYDPGTNNWRLGRKMPVALSGVAAVMALNRDIYVFGGNLCCRSNDGGYEMLIYDTANNRWLRGLSMRHQQIGAAGTLAKNGEIYAIGGDSRAGILKTVQVYDPGSGTWRSGPPLPGPRDALMAATSYGHVYAIGGHDSGSGNAPNGGYVRTMLSYTP